MKYSLSAGHSGDAGSSWLSLWLTGVTVSDTCLHVTRTLSRSFKLVREVRCGGLEEMWLDVCFKRSELLLTGDLFAVCQQADGYDSSCCTVVICSSLHLLLIYCQVLKE